VIRKLTLTNWRNYQHVEIPLGPGTTFVVASNGVGKTSLVEAARFALFGAASTDSASPIQVGTGYATATIELVLPGGQVIAVERTLTTKKIRPSSSVVIQLDGAAIDDDAFERAIRDAYGAESAFLARLTMPATSRQMDVPTALGLEAHLGQYFGVDGLQRAIGVLADNVKSTETQIRQIKVGNAATARQIAEHEAAVTATAAAVETAAAEHAVAQRTHDGLRAEVQALQAHASWLAGQDQWMAQANEALDSIRQELQEEIQEAAVEDRLQQAIDEASTRAENARIHLAVNRSRVDLIGANQASLDASEDACPVCRRPLDDATVMLARLSNDADLEALEAESRAFRDDATSASEQRNRAQALLRRWRGIPAPGPEPDITNRRPVGGDDLEAAADQVTVALDRLVGARASEVVATRRLQAAREADEAMRTLENIFRYEAELRVALNATTRTRDELLEHTVRPLASQVNQRWAALFPGRGALSTRADATMTRTVNGHPLPFDAFSTGEGIGATVVLRLLVAQMATTADFCWFDEPLEHLDPNVRRQVANILAGATATDSRLRQVVVTTYEEPLARALRARAPEDVHLIDVRSAPANPVDTSPATSPS
jgi:DNA repair exonuclease SbcCD ATPase subunit